MESNLHTNNVKTFKTMVHAINALILRITLITVFLLMFFNLSLLKMSFKFIYKDPILLINFIYSLNGKKIITNIMPLKSFIIILVFLFLMLPLLHTLTAEISKDTVWFFFLITQLIYSIDAVGSSIKNSKYTKKKYKTNQTIPLEESILIGNESQPAVPYPIIVIYIGFLLLYSSMENKIDILILHALKIIFYYCIPEALEEYSVHLSPIKTFGCYFIGLISSFLIGNIQGFVFLAVTTVLYIFLNLLRCILEK